MKYNICVPLPVRSVNVSEIATTIKKVVSLSPNLIELRFDYIDDVQKLTKDFVTSLLSRIQPKIPVICTLRDYTEGGNKEIKATERLQLLKLIIESKPNYVDIEINTKTNFLRDIINKTIQNKVNLIFSYHDFKKTPNYIEASNHLENFLTKLKEEMLIDPKVVEKSIFKFIFTANSFEDNMLPLKLCKMKSSKKQKLVSFCMGDLGIFSRIFCIFSGSVLTYCSYKDKTAPGQININKLRNTLKLLNFRT
ncbi:MAG: 3-dehydroquinate dehydratase [Candidatus Lokiarchaeum sp. GC14_75]|nr:MAG: 3-dehydroquinate dehydratase [Candidatus Lokiarchaeum sp. GC14_75]